jgi:hypothetical protein
MMHASSNLKASEIVRSLQLPTGNHLDAYCHQLPRLSVPGSLSPLRIEAAFAPIRAHSRALHRLCIRETELAAIDILPFSMMFLHGGWLRLILNMQTLWLFGPTIDDRWVMAAVWCSISLAAWRLRSRTSCSIRLRSCPH